MFLITRGFFSADGVPAAHRLIDVIDRTDGSHPPLYGMDQVTPLSNPVETDSLGNLAFYIGAGQYKFVVSGYESPFDTTEGGGAIPPLKYHQSAPAATWTINHDRNTKPDVVLIADDDAPDRTFTDVSYPDDSTIVIEWPAPITGWAYVQ